MKKLFVGAAIVVAGLASAKDSKVEKIEMNKNVKTEVTSAENSQKQLKALIRDIKWIGVSTWCGKVFYLDANDYSNYEELDAAATYFTNQQCAGVSTFTQQFT